MAELDNYLTYLAQVSAPPGSPVAARLAELQALLVKLQGFIMDPTGDDAARAGAADQVDELVRILERVEPDFAHALATTTPQVRTAFRDADPKQVRDGLRMFAAWLRAPTPESTARVEQAYATLRGIGVTHDWESPEATARLDAELDARIGANSAALHADMAREIDDLFPVQPAGAVDPADDDHVH